MNTEFSNEYHLWYHLNNNKWNIDSYKHVYTIKTIADFWKLFNTWDNTNSLTSRHYFLMKKDIKPTWEDNSNGGCWSIKSTEADAITIWTQLSAYMICEILCPKISSEIIGLSICMKKNNSVIIKIWNSNNINNSIEFINKDILNQWGIDIIYISYDSK